MFKKYSMKKQFIFTFALVIVSSILAVLLTVILALSLINGRDIKYANYYEKIVPEIEAYIKENNTKLLNTAAKKDLEKVIPQKGIKYRVLGLNSKVIYGTLESPLENKEELINKLNTTNTSPSNIVTKYIPIISEENLSGVVILEYTLNVTSDSIPKVIISLVSIITLISPFIYIILFSYLFGLKLTKNINIPLDKLKWASNKVKNKDLDFELKYEYNNELGEVINSFNEMKEELKNTLNKQWNLEEERRTIISGLSHDLRSPLTVIKGKLELLLEGTYKNEERLLNYLNSIDKSTDRAIALVEDLNIINKIENPEFNISISEVNIIRFLNEKIDSIKSLLDEKNIFLNLNTINIEESKLWKFDEKSTSRVLDNILINAIRHSKENGCITISVEIKDTKLNFKIDDIGDGFTDRDLKLALNRFYRGDKSRGAKTGNSGLGLYISKIIIEKHNGEINISNNTLGGASVEFYIT